MIQTKQEISFGDRSEFNGIIKIETRPQDTTFEGTNYLVIDYDISNNKAYSSKVIFYSNEKKTMVNNFIENTYNLTGLEYPQKEWVKVAIGLMLDTQTNLFPSGNTIYRCLPDAWEYSPYILELLPSLTEQQLSVNKQLNNK